MTKRRFTNYVAKTSGRPRRKAALTNYRLHVSLTEEEQRQTREWAAFFGITMGELCRKALHMIVRAQRRQFKPTTTCCYVRLPDGTYHPPLCELGYEFEENAQRYANRTPGATIVWLHPAAPVDGDGSVAQPGVAPAPGRL